MSRFANNLAAAVVAIMITATSLTAVTTVPAETQVAVTAAPMLA